MGGYGNGQVPLGQLVYIGPEHYLLPGVNAHWQGLVGEARASYGVTLRITGGWNGYRPLAAQEQYLRDNYTAHVLPVAGYEYYWGGRWWKRRPGKPKAAKPGTSPHGAYGAVDVANWRDLARTEREAWAIFAALCAKWRFATQRVPGELWHIEFTGDPWAIPSWAGSGSNTFEPNPEPEPQSEEDDDMPKNSLATYRNDTTSPKPTYTALVYNAGSGFNVEFTNGANDTPFTDGYLANLRASHDTGPAFATSKGAADVIKAACAKVLAGG
ncbi:hypothetical protein GCM10009775_04760 [Microbacterium aoyamense]|uniref:Endolysin n=1 Tax=Microbacterium aoyamense TaxID=344166 RepID=A0ABN2P9I9_9MICO|nr:hypothetical protein [Microbacterium aoyamense]